jgi:hypothetical protein
MAAVNRHTCHYGNGNMADKALKFMKDDYGDDTDGDDYTIVIKTVGHNVQSLLAHKEDIETDFV